MLGIYYLSMDVCQILFLRRCGGSIERARLYVDSQLGYGCELTMMETERRYTGNGKSSIHYHVVRLLMLYYGRAMKKIQANLLQRHKSKCRRR